MGKINYTTAEINTRLGKIGGSFESVSMSRDDSGVTFTFKTGDGKTATAKIPIAVWNGLGDNDGVAGAMSPYKVRLLEEKLPNDIKALRETIDSIKDLSGDFADSQEFARFRDDVNTRFRDMQDYVDQADQTNAGAINDMSHAVTIRPFSGIVDNVTVEQVGFMGETNLFTQIVYDTTRKRFLLFNGKYYEAWSFTNSPDSTSVYNGPDGPRSQLYVRTNTRSLYWWDGDNLVELTKTDEIAELQEKIEELSASSGGTADIVMTDAVKTQRSDTLNDAVGDSPGVYFFVMDPLDLMLDTLPEAPAGTRFYAVKTVTFNQNNHLQELRTCSSPCVVWSRCCVSGTWSAWTKLA